MKAITIHQPWASLVAIGSKGFETRGWATKYRGSLAIHAGVKAPFDVLTGEDVETIIRAGLALGLRAAVADEGAHAIVQEMDEKLPRGAVIATTELVECWKVEHIVGCRAIMQADSNKMAGHIFSSDNEVLFGNWAPGRFAWELANVVMLQEPVPARGQQGLWEVDL